MQKTLTKTVNLLEERLGTTNRHGFIIADPGEGKYHLTKKEIEAVLQNTRVLFAYSYAFN